MSYWEIDSGKFDKNSKTLKQNKIGFKEGNTGKRAVEGSVFYSQFFFENYTRRLYSHKEYKNKFSERDIPLGEKNILSLMAKKKNLIYNLVRKTEDNSISHAYHKGEKIMFSEFEKKFPELYKYLNAPAAYEMWVQFEEQELFLKYSRKYKFLTLYDNGICPFTFKTGDEISKNNFTMKLKEFLEKSKKKGYVFTPLKIEIKRL